MSGMNPNNRFVSPTDDMNRAGAEGTINVNVVGNMNEIANRTTDRLFQVVSESPQSSELIVSSRSRTRGSPFNFTSDIGGPLYRGRTARLTAAIVPGLANINRSNNEVRMQIAYNTFYAPGSQNSVSFILPINFTIPYGYYSPTKFSEVFSSLVHDKIQGLIGTIVYDNQFGISQYLNDILDLTVTCPIITDTFKLDLVVNSTLVRTSSAFPSPGGLVQAGFHFSFWFDETCSFITRGIHMVPFIGSPLLIPGTGVTSAAEFPSTRSIVKYHNGAVPFQSFLSHPASFYYSRYITVLSQNLSLYTFGESRVDIANGGGGSGKIVGVFATARYNGNAGLGPYAGIDVLKSVDAPTLGIRNAQLKLNELIDFRFQDEFGIDLDQVFPVDNVDDPTLAFNITY